MKPRPEPPVERIVVRFEPDLPVPPPLKKSARERLEAEIGPEMTKRLLRALMTDPGS